MSDIIIPAAIPLDAMEKMGFPVVDGKVMVYVDDDGNTVSPSRARKELES